MSDLVERLRDWSDGPETAALCDAAADRLEQLEKAIANLLKVRGRYHTELAFKELERVYYDSQKPMS